MDYLFENFFRKLSGDKRFSEEERNLLLKRASQIELSFEFDKAIIKRDVKLVDFLHDKMQEPDIKGFEKYGWSKGASIEEGAKAIGKFYKEENCVFEKIKEKLTPFEKEKLNLIEEGIEREMELSVATSLRLHAEARQSRPLLSKIREWIKN